MKWILRIIGVIGPFVFGTWLSTLSLSKDMKTISWIICSLISISFIVEMIIDLHHQTEQEKSEKEKAKIDDYLIKKLARIELLQSGLPASYINGLGDNPDLKYFLEEGKDYEAKNEYINAINKYISCLNHPKATIDNKVALNILIGNCYLCLSKFIEALNYYKNALMISQSLEEINDRLRGRSITLGNIGLIYGAKGMMDDALKYHTSALEIDRKIGYELGIANDLGNIGLIYITKGKMEEALSYHHDALEIHRKIGHDLGMANDLGNIGLVYFNMGQAKDALSSLHDALEINQKISNELEMANNLGNIGVVLLNMGKAKDALEYLRNALAIYRKIGNEFEVANDLGNIGVVYRNMRRKEDALKYHQDALEIHRKVGYELSIANDLGNIGDVYRDMGKAKDALGYLQDALVIFKKIGASSLIIQTEENIKSIQKTIK